MHRNLVVPQKLGRKFHENVCSYCNTWIPRSSSEDLQWTVRFKPGHNEFLTVTYTLGYKMPAIDDENIEMKIIKTSVPLTP